MKRPITYFLTILSLLLYLDVDPLGAQGTDIQFGKNRVQVKEFDWRYYRSDEFDIYYYTGGKELARFVGRHASQYLDEMEEALDYQAQNRLKFMVYNSFADLRQTNIGYTEDSDDPSGMTPIVNNHAFLYFKGDHFDLMDQIQEGTAQVLLNEMLYGGSIQERVQNTTLINLPDWYLKGLAEYLGNPMSIEERSRLRSGILSGRFERFQHLAARDQKLISQAIWKYIGDVYGESSITNIIYLNRVNKSLESGFVFVLGKDYNDVFEEWYQYMRREFREEQNNIDETIPYKDKPASFEDGRITQIAMGPKGQNLAYVTNEMGKKHVWLYNFKEESHEKVYKTGYKTNMLEMDDNYPLIAWRPVQNQLTIVDDKESVPVFMQYNPEKEEIVKERKNFRVEKVLDMNYSPDGRFIALSGVKQGNTNVFVFNWQTNTLRPITKDQFDDRQPVFAEEGEAIVFSSNRANGKISRKQNRWDLSGYNDNYDIFYYRYKQRDQDLKRLTFTPAVNETNPNVYDSTYFSYLTSANGIVNRGASRLDSLFQFSRLVVQYVDTSRYPADTFNFQTEDSSSIFVPSLALKDTTVASMDTTFHYKDTAYTHTLTNRPKNIFSYNVNRKRDLITEFYRGEDQMKMAQYPLPDSPPLESVEPYETNFARDLKAINKKRRASSLVLPPFKGPAETSSGKQEGKGEKSSETDTGSVDIDDYYFQSEFEENAPSQDESEKGNSKSPANDELSNRKNGSQDKSAMRRAREREREMMGDPAPYFLSFTPNFIQSQLDNSIINTKYLPFNRGDQDPFVYNPVLNMMFQMGVSDIFQDYRITGGMRILGNLQGADYFMRYQNLKNRLDQKLTFFRHGEKKQFDNGSKQKQETSHGLRYQLKWPFSEKSSIRGKVFARRDNDIVLSSERSTLTEPNTVQNWMGLNFSYVFDNTRKLSKNLKAGTRLKFYTEGFRSFQFEGEGENKLFSVFGGDVRNYIPIFRDMIWANRLSFASSFGKAKVVYFMGGVDNWLFPQYNDDVQVSKNQNYVYKSLATNLRGFSQNIRNGNSYAVLNSEIRIPLFKMFYNKPVISSFLKNFQLIGFGDLGSAWTGTNPFGENNALNRQVYDDNPYLDISVINLSNPIVGGAGVGIRTNLLGYFVRIDHAWGFEDNRFKKEGMTYISLGVDF